ncbi:nucleotidyltransferase family protein [Saccharospirillum impatiens]|uniref:nucleotidyltransferase family protein n=1 Tax=Saccharospirillum impatiens TaxID=169438 RepID=UPI0004155291|nr:nucleotidyltransferase family protein [Saccharospirillum impatiens]
MRIVAIVLAAGESRRMGDRNKLLLPMQGKPLLRRTVETVQGADVSRLIVVLGHEADKAREVLSGLAVETVYNPDYQVGQMTSVHAGLSAITGACDGVMICLTDQPLLTPQDLNELIDGFANRTRGSILVPTWQGQRGNPILLASEHCETIVKGETNLGCRRLLEKHPEQISTLAMSNDHVVVDMDTPEAYEQVCSRLHRADTVPANPESTPAWEKGNRNGSGNT